MTAKELFLIIFCGVWCLIGLVFLSIGQGLTLHRKKKQRECSETVWGRIADVVPYCGQGCATLTPMVEYETPLGTMRQLSPFSSTRCRYALGQAVQVWYDPADPSRWYLEGDRSSRVLGTVFTLIGVACFGVALIVGVCVGFAWK